MKNRIIIFSDPHFHSHPQFGGERVPDGTPIQDEIGDSRFPGCNVRAITLFTAVEWAIRQAEKNEAKTMICLGDVFHTKGNVPVPIFNGASKVFYEAHKRGIVLHAIPGNHDYVGKTPNWSSLNTLYSIPNCEVTFFPRVIPIQVGSKVLAAAFVPYMPSHETMLKALKKVSREAQTLVAAGKATHTALFLHTSVNGATVGPHEYVMTEGLKLKEIPFEAFNTVVSGHYHKRQALDYHGNRFYYCGAIAQHNVGERTYVPGILMMTLKDEGVITFSHIENRISPRFEEATIDNRRELEAAIEKVRNQKMILSYEDIEDAVGRDSRESLEPPIYLKVNWTGSDFPDDLDIPTDRVIIERVPTVKMRPRIEFDMSKETPESLVTRYVEETSIDNKDNAALIETGLEILKEAL